MKTFAAIGLLLIGATIQAQQSVPQVVARGPNSRTWAWESESDTILPNGQKRRERHGYVEVGTALCRWDADRNQWVDASEVLEIIPGAAVGRSAQVQARFSQNLNTFGATTLWLPPGNNDGQPLEFRSHILGIALTDVASGRSALIAEVQDCAGEVIPPRTVLYRDAIAGIGLRADVLLEYRLAGVSQSVVIRSQPQITPADLGMDPGTCVWEIWTEAVSPVNPRRLPQGPVALLQSSRDPAAAPIALPDEEIDFGSTRMIAGRAFAVGSRAESDPFADDALRVSKTWVVEPDTGRQCLVEAVPYLPLRDRLAAELPEAKAEPAVQRAAVHAQRQFPRAPLQAKADSPLKPMQMASRPRQPGYVVDFELVSSGSGWVFQGGTTYLISSICYLDQQTVFEGGAVLKYTNSSGYLRIRGTVDCQTTEWNPVVFTSMHDDSIGETITGSTNTPAGYVGFAHIYFETANTLRNMRFLYGNYAVATSSADLDLYNIQARNCHWALRPYSARIDVHNLLVSQCDTAIYSVNGTGSCHVEHGTIDRVTTFATGSTNNIYLTNCLVTAASGSVAFNGASNTVAFDRTGIYQEVGAGEHYLVDNSPYRGAGTTNLSPEMRAALRNLTTYPPLVLTNPITTDTVLSPIAERDTASPDLGYHYAAEDFAVNAVVITNQAKLTIEPGVGIIAFGEAAFCLEDCAEVDCEGEAVNRIQFARYNGVQEGSLLWGGGSSFRYFRPDHGLNDPAALRFRFVDFHLPPMPYPTHHLYTGFDYETGQDLASVSVRDCAFSGGKIEMNCSPTAWAFTNNLIDRVWWIAYDGSEFWFYNNYFRGGVFDLWNNSAADWTFRDNAFQETALYSSDGTYDHNAYLGQTDRQYWVTNQTDKVLPNFVFEAGPLGRYYQPTDSDLIDAGSRDADLVGLYHYTALIDESKEEASLVEIGLHYVAVTNVGGAWVPIDSDGDGIEDYLEDVNGNGLTDPGETSYSNPILSIAASVEYIKGGPPKLLDANATVSDIDSLDFAGGELQVALTYGADLNDELSIRNQGTDAAQIGFSGSTVTYGGTAIGTATGGSGTNALVISFNTNASHFAVEALARNLTFYHPSNSPPDNTRIAQFILTDGDGGTNTPASMTIQVMCPEAIDAMLVFDVSKSIWDTNFAAAKLAASNFVSQLNPAVDRLGLISFAETAVCEFPLTNDAGLAQASIAGLTNRDGTVIQPAIDLARTNLSQSGSNVLRLIMLLSDGETSYVTNALQAAAAAAEAGIRIISLACLGHPTNKYGTNLMSELASSPHDYYFAPVSDDFHSNFMAVAMALCRGGILVDAGPDQLFNVSNQTFWATMAGVATVGGLPSGSLTYHWTQESGAGATWFSDPVATNSTVNFSAPGNYILRLTASDGLVAVSDTVNITFNQPPVVSAGADRVAPAGTNVALAGTVRDDALPVGGALTSLWTVVEGPPGVTLGNPVQTNSSVYFPSNGTYTLRLTAGDGAVLAFDEVTFTVRDPRSRTFTRNVDFAEGMLVNLNYDAVPDQLQLNTNITPFPYVNIACSSRGTVVRIDANTGQIIGEYQTAPDAMYSNPSRTTVDRYGNVWVANRDEYQSVPDGQGGWVPKGSVTRIGLVVGGTRGFPTNDNVFMAV